MNANQAEGHEELDTFDRPADGQYHTYAVEISRGTLRTFREGIETTAPWRSSSPMTHSVIPRLLLAPLPSAISKPIEQWRSPDFAESLRLQFSCCEVPPVDPTDRLTLEVDYLRIWQE